MKGRHAFKSKDSYKITKQRSNVSFETDDKLSTAVKQHVIACVQSALPWRQHMLYDQLAIDQSLDQ